MFLVTTYPDTCPHCSEPISQAESRMDDFYAGAQLSCQSCHEAFYLITRGEFLALRLKQVKEGYVYGT